MEQGNFFIDWRDFKATSAERFKDFVGKTDFSDVTLVCGDGQRIPSHQVILATACTFFKNLLEKEDNPKPLIFMRGVEAALLEPLLLFLYTGKAEISELLITEFLILAEDLGVEGLANNPGKEVVNEVPGLAEDLEVEGLTKNLKKEIDHSMEEPVKDVSEEKNKKDNRTVKPKMCPMCNRAFNDSSNLKRHIASHSKKRILNTLEPVAVPARSEDGFYHCQYCEKEVKDGSNIRRHIRNVHQNKNEQKHFVISS